MPRTLRSLLLLLLIVLGGLLTACDALDSAPPPASNGDLPAGPSRPANLETAVVTHVVDGDTVDLDNGERVRLLGINTPERDQPFYTQASDFTRGLAQGQTVGIETDLETRDQYGRLLAHLWLGETLLNYQIVGNGYANVLTLPPNDRYTSELLAAERYAREHGLGLWARPADIALTIQHIEFNPPGEDLAGEYVTISNDGGATVDLSGFTLQDAANTVYTFPRGASLRAGGTLRVYSGSGSDTASTFYWNNDTPIWNNSGDVATLRDDQGDFIHIYRYQG